jgi:hypothetical protein
MIKAQFHDDFEELDFGCNFSFHVTSISFYVISFKCSAIAYALHLKRGGGIVVVID